MKVELWPGGDHRRRYTLALATLTCLGAATRDDATSGVRKGERAYRVRLFKDTSFGGPDGSEPERLQLPRDRDVWREGFVRGHRPGERGVWDLLGGALDVVLKGRLGRYGRLLDGRLTAMGKGPTGMTGADVVGAPEGGTTTADDEGEIL